MWTPGDALAELDRLVHGRVRRDTLREEELVGADAQRRAKRRLQLVGRPPCERLQRMVERPHPLNGSERQPHREPPVAVVELSALGLGAKGAVGVGVLLERAPHDLAGDGARAHAARSGARRRPRR